MLCESWKLDESTNKALLIVLIFRQSFLLHRYVEIPAFDHCPLFID